MAKSQKIMFLRVFTYYFPLHPHDKDYYDQLQSRNSMAMDRAIEKHNLCKAQSL